MNRVQVVRKIREFLDRTEILGAEADQMVLCKAWLANAEKQFTALDTEPRTGVGAAVQTPASQVADTIEK
jgi:hypothetical protein